MRVSARLQATAAPEAPEPMISTSTLSFMLRIFFLASMRSLRRGGNVIPATNVAPVAGTVFQCGFAGAGCVSLGGTGA